MLAQLREETVQLRRRHTRDVPLELTLDHVEETLDPAAGRRGDCDVRWPLSQAALELRTDVVDRDRRQVPLREDDDGRALRLARNVGDGEVMLDDALCRVDQDERDVRTLLGVERTEIRVVLDAMPMAPLPPHSCLVDEDEGAIVSL